jgi:putative CocE/NonD family hydrolase
MDGAGYANSAIARYLTMDRNPRHLCSALGSRRALQRLALAREGGAGIRPARRGLRFFDEYLMDRRTGLRDEAPIHYFSLHEERWRSAAQWPPVEGSRRLHLAEGGALVPASGPLRAACPTDASWGSGDGTRYERIAGINSTTYYPDWEEREARLPSFTSAPLDAATELTGHVLADLLVESSERDAAIILYLSEVEVDGTVRYVTEGLLRALHRAEAPPPPEYRCTWPFRTFHRRDASPLTPGVAERIRVPLLATSWTFAAGSRIASPSPATTPTTWCRCRMASRRC